MKKTIIIYGVALATVLMIFKLIEYTYFSHRISLDTYLGIVAIIFLTVGLIVGKIFLQKQQAKIAATQEASTVETSQAQAKEMGLSQRELEVLEFIAEGYSNQEIAEKLFVSINTIKTHITNIYSKLDVRRRTQAVSKAKELKIIN